MNENLPHYHVMSENKLSRKTGSKQLADLISKSNMKDP